jgi:hypothetical protein
MFAGPAPYVANAVLTAGIHFSWTLLTKFCHFSKHLNIPGDLDLENDSK